MRVVLSAVAVLALSSPAYAAFDGGMPVNRIRLPDDMTKACLALEREVAQQGWVKLKRLNELPPALLEHAVLRLVDGCPVREVVYRGQVYYVDPTAPPT